MPCCCILPQKTYLKQKPQVLVITNYRPDQQKSMLRFGDLLVSHYSNDLNFNIKEIYPASVFRKICPIGKLRKWAAYVDKYLLFPKKLKRNLISRKDPLHLIHITDHSNAIYSHKISRITQAKKIITCHDLIAIRTANGDFAQAPKTSKTGVHLQNWISKSIRLAN